MAFRHPRDAARLSDARFRDTLSEAIAVAVTDFFSPID
jgi:N-acetylmuramoyl-L-alanine amidase